MKELKQLNNLLFELRQQLVKSKSTPDWSHNQLINVLKSLKNKKARDPHGMINELFKEDLAGNDLINSLLLFLNGTKRNVQSFQFLELTNITSIYKNSGEKANLNNERSFLT